METRKETSQTIQIPPNEKSNIKWIQSWENLLTNKKIIMNFLNSKQ